MMDESVYKGKSQIDFCLTNSIGRRQIKSFNISSNDWHLSDHRPITLVLEVDASIDTSKLLKRAIDLNCTNNDSCNGIQQFKGSYDYDAIERGLLHRKDEIENSIGTKLHNNDVLGAIDVLDEHVKSVHKLNKKQTISITTATIDMSSVNKEFDEYLLVLSNKNVSETDVQISLEHYMSERKTITKEIMKSDAQKWEEVVKSNDAKTFWQYIDRKGNLKRKKTSNSPPIQQFEVFFEELYKCKNQRELYEIMEIDTDVIVPILDEPITDNEIKLAFRAMKKPGFDYNLPILSILVTYFSFMLVNIMNMIR